MIVKDLPVGQFFVLRERIDGPKVPDQHNSTTVRMVLFYRNDHDLTESVRIGYGERAATLVPVIHLGFLQTTEHHDMIVSKFRFIYGDRTNTFLPGSTPVETMSYSDFAEYHDKRRALYNQYVALQEMFR